jgi:hypothetical protein
MTERLFRVRETFQLQGRGLVIATDALVRSIPRVLCAGQSIEFRRRDGRRILSIIKSLEFASPFNPNRTFAFLADDGITKDDVPPETEVWLGGNET